MRSRLGQLLMRHWTDAEVLKVCSGLALGAHRCSDPAGMPVVLGVMQEAVEVLRSRLCSARVAGTIFIDVRVVVCGGKVGDIRTDGARITRHVLFGITAFKRPFFSTADVGLELKCFWFEGLFGAPGFSY